MTKDLEFTDGKKWYASWKVIEDAYRIDRANNPNSPKLKKITPEHINPTRKMRVKHATQVLSETMASNVIRMAEIQGKLCNSQNSSNRQAFFNTAMLVICLQNLLLSMVKRYGSTSMLESARERFFESSISCLTR